MGVTFSHACHAPAGSLLTQGRVGMTASLVCADTWY